MILFLKGNHQVKNCKKSKPCNYCKGFHNSGFCFQKDKKCASPKLAEEIKQDENVESTENTHGCHVQSNVSFVMLQAAVVVVVKNPKDSKEVGIKIFFITDHNVHIFLIKLQIFSISLPNL